MLVVLVFDLVLSCGVMVVSPVVGASRSLFLFEWLLNEKAARVEINVSLAFTSSPRLTFFVSDIAIFVMKWDVKLQLIGNPVSVGTSL